MPIDGLKSFGDAAVPASMTAVAIHGVPSSAAVVAIEAEAEVGPLVDQLAAGGDPAAEDRLRQAYDRLSPTPAAGIGAVPVQRPAGAAEPGKGGLVDLYD